MHHHATHVACGTYYPFFPCMLTTHCSTTFERLTIHRTSRGMCQLQRKRVDMPSHNACIVRGTYRPCMLAMQHSQCSSVSPYVCHRILHRTRWTQHKHVITPLRIACTWHVTPIVTFKHMSTCIQSCDAQNTLAIAQTRERTIACRTCDAWCTLPLVTSERMSVCVPSHVAWNALAMMRTREHTIACRACDAWCALPFVITECMSVCVPSHAVQNASAIAQTHEHTITCDAWCVLPLCIDTYHPYQTYPHISERISMYLNIS